MMHRPIFSVSAMLVFVVALSAGTAGARDLMMSGNNQTYTGANYVDASGTTAQTVAAGDTLWVGRYFNGTTTTTTWLDGVTVMTGAHQIGNNNAANTTFAGQSLFIVNSADAPAWPLTYVDNVGLGWRYQGKCTIADLRMGATSFWAHGHSTAAEDYTLDGMLTILHSVRFRLNVNSALGEHYIINAKITGAADQLNGLHIVVGNAANNNNTNGSYLTFNNPDNDFTGSITQTGSVFQIGAGTALGKITRFSIDGTGAGTLAAIFQIPAAVTTVAMPNLDVVVGANGQISMAGSTFTVKSLTVNGTPLSIGSHSVATLAVSYPANFTGTGNIIIGGAVNPVKPWRFYN